MSTHHDIPTPAWARPLLQDARYKAAFGGRGSGKSWFFASLVIDNHIRDSNFRTVCIREVQKSLNQSVKRLLEQSIESLGVGHLFDVQQSCIKNLNGNGMIIFQGMQNHTADSIKSLEGYDVAWVEEAQTLSQFSLDLLRPTIRKESSEIWFSWNPRFESDPVDVMFRGEDVPPSAVVVHVNWDDNPWFPSVLKAEMEHDRSRDVEKYAHVWEGGYVTHSESRVFKNWTIEEFDTPAKAELRFGADWGFANDPTVLIRAWREGRRLYVDHEAYRVGCEIVDTPSLFASVPDAERWPIVADGARPETISHMRNNGFPKIVAATKGKGSVEDGIEWLKSCDMIVHPRCRHTIDELTHYSYKVDQATGQVLPILEDANNHVIDALRYAFEGVRRLEKQTKRKPVRVVPVVSRWK